MSFWSKKNIPSGETKEVTVLTVGYRVTWLTVKGEYGYSWAYQESCRFFPQLEDATLFCVALNDAMSLLADKRPKAVVSKEPGL